MWIAKQIARYGNLFEKSHLHSITKQVKDVLRVRGLLENAPYIVLEGNRVDLPSDTFLANVSLLKEHQYCQFYDVHYNRFYLGTPLLRIISESFFIQLGQALYYVHTNEPLMRPARSPIFARTDGSYILEPIVSETLRELEGTEGIERGVLHNHMIKNVIDNSDEIKLDRLRYKELLKVVEGKLAVFEDHIRIVEQGLREKAERRVRLFSSFMVAQVAVLHYFIYFNLSWDIMEPVTVILGNFDLLVAYYFFLLRGRPYSPENWKESIVQHRRLKHLERQGVDTAKYEELLDIRDDFKMRLGLLSKNPLAVL
jgi:hypothetical protein